MEQRLVSHQAWAPHSQPQRLVPRAAFPLPLPPGRGRTHPAGPRDAAAPGCWPRWPVPGPGCGCSAGPPPAGARSRLWSLQAQLPCGRAGRSLTSHGARGCSPCFFGFKSLPPSPLGDPVPLPTPQPRLPLEGPLTSFAYLPDLPRLPKPQPTLTRDDSVSINRSPQCFILRKSQN